MYIYIYLYVCIKEEKQDILNTCIYVLKSKALKKKCPDTTLWDKKPSKNTNEFIYFFFFVHFLLGMQSTIKSSGFSQWDSFKRIKLFYVSGYQLIGVCFCVKIEGMHSFLLLLPKFHLVEIMGMLLQSLLGRYWFRGACFLFCFFFFICLPPSLTLIHVCFCFSLISLGTQERDLKQTFHVGLHVLRLSFLVLVLCICHHLQEEESFLKLSERKYRSMDLLQWNVWIFLFWEPAAYLIVM